ncbi:serine/threonine-protein kinase ATM isoform X3 [Momordica charantia]|uniref:Serine/threonine-protein kinase ATM n=1 Tax=Momordica charantia TaxID=3673 RepID=A0A6J1C1N7_MOMCH|nr:serine/threonine-protein kinase ATM isoform X3 [Momordica charantia]
MVTSRDVQDIISKLSSDKAKAREEGVKLLNTWLEGDKAIDFCKFIGHNTAKLRPEEIPSSETWPFITKLLIQCVSMEISSSKRRLPKSIFAKTLRVVVQKAEDNKFSGNAVPLISVVKMLFTHVWDVLSSISSFQSDYGIIIRHLVAVRDYRFHMRKRIYCNLMLLYLEKVEGSLVGKNDNHYTSKEELLPCILTLYSLLENPPGDFPDSIRHEIVNGIAKIFSLVRDEGKISRKLIECVNTYLLKDGPNLGSNLLEIHNSVQQFVFRCWMATHDRALKDALVLYGRLQTSLMRGADDERFFIEQLLDVLYKELDQSSISSVGVPWSDTNKDDKFGTLSSSHCGLVELAAAVLYRACVTPTKAISTEKRVKRDPASVHLKEALAKGKWLWNAAFCCLAHNYHSRISKDLFIYWFEAISLGFERIVKDANVGNSYDGLLWTLRSLQELSVVLLDSVERSESSSEDKLHQGWQSIWSCLMHGLPMFSHVFVVAEAALLLLGKIIERDLMKTCVIPQDVWEHLFFKRMPSISALYLISRYFSRKGSQGDLRDIFHLRKNLLRAVLGHLNLKEVASFNRELIFLLPAAVYALCAGCAPFRDVTEFLDECIKKDVKEETYQDWSQEVFECSVEVVAKIHLGSSVKVCPSLGLKAIHLPRQIRDPLLDEMETYVLGTLIDVEREKVLLSNVFILCALLANFICGSTLIRQREQASLFISRLGHYILEMTGHAVNVIQGYCRDFKHFNCFGSDSFFDLTSSVVTSFRSFASCPIFKSETNHNALDVDLYGALILSMENFLKALSELYQEYSRSNKNLHSEVILKDFDAPITLGNFPPVDTEVSRILDVELDVNDDSNDMDVLAVKRSMAPGMSSATIWKLRMISLISSFCSVLHEVTWEVLFELLEKECDSKVCEEILYHLSQNILWSSSEKVMNLMNIMDNLINTKVNLKLDLYGTLDAVGGLLRNLSSLDGVAKSKHGGRFLKDAQLEKNLVHIGKIVNRIAEADLLDWLGRIKLIDCICDLILINPQIGQTMIERLFVMLRDPEYRVRFSLAKRIGVLFQTWDGHEELFQDICSGFGVSLVLCSKEKVVTAREVLDAGGQPRPTMETIIVTLAHLALHSDSIELEVVFMMCAISAIDPSQREMVSTMVDNLARQLNYSGRQKYLEEHIGSLLFCWVTCGVSLPALIEIRQLFVLDAEPSYFIQYCCHWLLPALILRGDSSNLGWIANVAGEPLEDLIRSYFVAIFSICIALHCSKRSGWEKGAIALQSSMLHFARITESERDILIKKHMVSIISQILALTSCASEPMDPFFPKDTIVLAVRTVVDGFLEMEDNGMTIGVIDRINVFRPDRVFMFIVEMHYKITEAINHRHKSHRLAAIEVLINILGHRAAVSSTSNYLFNLIGLFIGDNSLQDQCCRILSTLLESFKSSPGKEITRVLGEQLQLVACCIPSEADGESPGNRSSHLLSLVRQLTMDSDSSLYDYIKELEPFPEIDIFDDIRKFHLELCRGYSPRDHLLKLVERSGNLPPRLLLWSLKALHRKLIGGQVFHSENTQNIDWHNDHEVERAVWKLMRMCGSDDTSCIRELVSDFVSRVGIGDPHCVVFHLPGDSNTIHIFRPAVNGSASEIDFKIETGISEDLLVELLKHLKRYLMDDSVKIVDMTSQVLQAVLSTEKGQSALLTFDSYERSLLEVHSKGLNIKLVDGYVLDLERRFKAEAISVESTTVWETNDKTFEKWICPLVYSLIGHSNDVILRLCLDIVLLKAEIAELLLPSVVVNLAGRKDLDFDLHKLISLQVQEHIFVESNKLIRSIQVLLNTLNELRLYHVMEQSLVSLRKDNSKSSKASSKSSKSRSTSINARDLVGASNASVMSPFSWDKVYWLSIDYLIVAKAAVYSGSYFTSVMYVEHWCEEHFGCLTLGTPDFSFIEMLPRHIEILVSAVTRINEPDSLYGIIRSHKLTSQIITFEHEGNWSKALEYYDLRVRSDSMVQEDSVEQTKRHQSISTLEDVSGHWKPYKGVIRSLQKTGCAHVLDLYCQGLTFRDDQFQHDLEFMELQYEAAWRAGNWDFSLLYAGSDSGSSSYQIKNIHFNENLHSCLRALQEGDFDEFYRRFKDSKQELVWSITHASEESTEYIYSTIIKLQIFYHLGMAWGLRWTDFEDSNCFLGKQKVFSDHVIPTMDQLSLLNFDWGCILKRTQLHMDLLEPFIAFRRVLLQVLKCKECMVQHLLQSASTLRKGFRYSQAAAALHEFKSLSLREAEENSAFYWLGRLEEAKLLRAQGRHSMAISLAEHVSQYFQSNEEASDVLRLVGKWLAETRSSNSRTILEKYLKPAVSLAEGQEFLNTKSVERQSQTHFHLAHYADALFKSYEERLNSNEWQAAVRLRKHKTMELEALIRRLKCSTEGEKTDFTVKIQELQKQLSMDREEADKLQDDRDNFLSLALEGYKRCLEVGDKYDVRVVFRLVSLWFSLSSSQNVINNMRSTIVEVQSYKFIPLVYQIASRMGCSKDGQGTNNFQLALVSLVKKMAIDHPYHTILQLLALANGDRVKDKQRSRNSFIVDMDKKLAAEYLLKELLSYHGALIRQVKQMVEIYIKLAELETRREDTNKRMTLPRELRSLRPLELIPVVTATFPVDRSCQYQEGSFPYFKGLGDTIKIMNGINAPKVIECEGSDGHRYRQLAKSGNDDLRQDAVMEQFFGLVNTFLQNHQDTRKRRLGIRTYKVVPFTPSAGVLEWVDGTIPLGEYLIGSTRNGGAHGRYRIGDWSFLECRDYMAKEKDKRKAFQEVCENFRPVMHYFFLERFLQPADWFEKRLAYTRSVAASSMVGYIVGLGDRHSMNILIDQATAEVVHIDLGVAFEQGLMLKTPERVPFRLTRDVIDGMGVTGVEGVFRRCCEETLSVMRTNKEALLTIVEVFIHDPLYKWALSPLKALQRQKETDDDVETSLEGSEDEYEGNKDAARALMRVKQKLDGYEDGEMRSVHGQVQQLIQDAIDPDRLCNMFPGWGAWL